MVLGELAGDPAPAAEVGRCALALLDGTSAARADLPSDTVVAGWTHCWRASACLQGLYTPSCPASKDVVVEEEAADLAAARACRGSPTSIVSESRMQGRLKNKLKNDGNSQGARLLCVGQSHDIVSSERALDEQRDPC